MIRPTSRILLGATLAAALLAACSKRDEAATDDTDTTTAQEEADSQPVPAPPAATSNAAPTSAPLDVADIDRWQRGMEAELEAVHEAGAKLKAARSGEDSLTAIMASNDMSTRDAGASAAGVDPERYQFIRTALSSATGSLSPLEMEMKVSDMPAAMVDQMKKAREASIAQLADKVPAPVIEALRPRAAALRKQDMTLVVERLKAAGMAAQ